MKYRERLPTSMAVISSNLTVEQEKYGECKPTKLIYYHPIVRQHLDDHAVHAHDSFTLCILCYPRLQLVAHH